MKILNTVFIIVFMAALLVPLSFMNLSDGIVSERENRMLAAQPSLSYARQNPRDFVRQFDDWFADNIGFREKFIEINDIVKKLENNVQYTDGQYTYLIGQQGHRYFAYTDGWMISKFQGKLSLPDEKLIGLSTGLEEIRGYLREKNIPFVVMLCADKETIYPEYYPTTIMRGAEPDYLDTITDFIKENTKVDIFNIKQCLLAEKDNYLLYPKDIGSLTHYNDVGAFFAYQELMNHINAYLPNAKPLTIDDVDVVYNENLISTVSLRQEVPYRILESDFFDDDESPHHSDYATENVDSSLPKILILRDSYAAPYYLGKYLPVHFSKAVFIHFSNMTRLREYIDLYKPDIVVFESAERELGGFASSVISYLNTHATN